MSDIRLDVFPAIIRVSIPDSPSREVQKVRVVVDRGRVIVAQDSDTGPLVIYNRGIDAFIRHGKDSHPHLATILDTAGFTTEVFRQDTCNCGSRLRSWNPYRTVFSSKDPLPEPEDDNA